MPTISLCMMVRDSAKTLKRAVTSARPFVDEVCIIDTGSVDATPRIARRLADRYEERTWPDDFAKARNWTLDLATSDYCLILDSDEYLRDGKANSLRRLLESNPQLIALDFNVVNLSLGGWVQESLRQPRLLKNTPLLSSTLAF